MKLVIRGLKYLSRYTNGEPLHLVVLVMLSAMTGPQMANAIGCPVWHLLKACFKCGQITHTKFTSDPFCVSGTKLLLKTYF